MNTPSNDRPLSGMAKVALVTGAAAIIGLFYLFVLGSVLFLLAILAVEFVVLLALLRFGMGRIMTPVIGSHGTLLKTFLGSLRVRKSAEFRIPLLPKDAPGLFQQLEKICERAKVPLPREVSLQMGVNAWVRMKGYRQGAGTTILGIGYDLLAGLSQIEIEGVLAHEMMHAKLVQRGFRQLVTKGVSRAAQLNNGLALQKAAALRVKQESSLAGMFVRCSDALTRSAARQMAACSRQDEFDADGGAAQLCGAAAIRSALLKLEGLNRIAARLPWRERVAQLESGEGFSQWLAQELAAGSLPEPTQTNPQAFNKYSTHPNLQDRLAALAAFPDQVLPDSPPGIGLLAHPDKVAEKLVAAIQKEVADQEQKDSKRLNRWSRRLRTSKRLRPVQTAGCFMGLVGVVVSCGIWSGFGMSLGLLAFIGLTLGGGACLYHFGRYREKFSLPVPDYSLIKTVSQKKPSVKQEQVKELETELRQLVDAETNQKQKATRLLLESHEALEKCDYVRAHVAARLCLEQDKQSVSGCLALGVAAAGLMLTQQTGSAIHYVQRNTGMKGMSPSWGAGWALLLLGDWVTAEAFLEQALKNRPADTTILALLAISQSRRGKLLTAILNARRACSPQPKNNEYTKLLIDLLLQGGFLREAREQLQKLESEALQDTELMFSKVRLNLLQRNLAEADKWTELVRQSTYGPRKFVILAEAFEAARQDQKAVEYYQLALGSGHYPEALLGLARVETHRDNKDQARAHLMTALDLKREAGEKSVGALAILASTLKQLILLEEPVLNCRAWIATLPGNVPNLANKSLMVYAPSPEGAKSALNVVLQAMQPGTPPPMVNWRPAAKEQQPDGPAYPGVQILLG